MTDLPTKKVTDLFKIDEIDVTDDDLLLIYDGIAMGSKKWTVGDQKKLGVNPLPSMAALSALDTSGLSDGQQFSVIDGSLVRKFAWNEDSGQFDELTYANTVYPLPDITSLSSLNTAALVDGHQFSVKDGDKQRIFYWDDTAGAFKEAFQSRNEYNTLADLKAETKLAIGQKVKTFGYTAVGDNGGNEYEIVAAATGSDDGGHFIDLSGSGLQAKALWRGEIADRQFGIIGSGAVDDTAQWSAALAVGLPVKRTQGSQYLISRLDIPADAIITGVGTTFLSDGSITGNTTIISVGNRSVIGELILELGTSNPAQRGIETSDDCKIGTVTIISDDQVSASDDNLDALLQLRGENLLIGHASVQNVDNSVTIFAASGYIDRLRVGSFKRGCYIRDTSNLTIGRFIGDQQSPNAVVFAGNNAILIESVSGAGSTNNVRILDIDIDGSGEHAIRIGGGLSVEDVYLGPSVIRNIGSSGIKILGGGSLDTQIHKRIVIGPYNMWDGGQGVNNNQCGILLQYCDDVTVAPGIIKKKDKTYSFNTGIRIDGCSNVSVSEPDISDTETDALQFDNGLAVSMTDVTVYGGQYKNGLGTGIIFNTAGITMTRVRVVGKAMSFGNGAGLTVAGGGTLVNCLVEAQLEGNGTTTNWGAAPAMLANLSGDYDASTFAANGSTYQEDGGSFYLRKGGAWVAL